MKVCIIGGVAGGASAAARLRRLSESAEIIMFERGEFISFANCGLPYHISKTIKSRDSLILQTPQSFKDRFNVDVRTFNEVQKIDKENKKIIIKNLKSQEIYEETYDKLILSPGAAPFVPPMEGVNLPHFMTLRNIPDMDRIIKYIKDNSVSNAVVIGGGFIGVEVAENLVEIGIDTNIVEMQNQLVTPLDFDMANIVHEELANSGMSIHLNSQVDKITQDGVLLKSGKKIKSQIVISAIGVRPESKLAKDSGLEIGRLGGVKVNSNMRTSDSSIYAVGDVIEVEHLVTSTTELIPLAGPANKQGRIAADNICGIDSSYKKTQGTGILKVFGLQVAFTGINEKIAKKQGLNYETFHIHPNNHAGYYPNARQASFKVIFEKKSGKLLGVQGIGADGVDKRIDVFATAIRSGLDMKELTELELSYAPPFGSAKDPVNMAGYVGENIMSNKVKIITAENLSTVENPMILDVRTKAEYNFGSIDNSINIEVDKLRANLDKIPKDKNIIITCQVGVRAYIAYRILDQAGFQNIYNLSGGYKSYRNYNYKIENDSINNITEDKLPSNVSDIEILDLSGLQCPGPIMKLTNKLESMEEGDSIAMETADPGFARDLASYCRSTKNTLVNIENQSGLYKAIVRKGNNISAPEVHEKPNNAKGKSIVVFSDDLDRAMATFIIANGAKSMGSEVTLFFTFWGLNLLKKQTSANVSKRLLDKMFGIMMPKGPSKTKLSKMNMLGVGTKMMNYIMKKKNVSSLPELITAAQQSGIKLVACSMSMDVMGIHQSELIEGVEIAGVANYLENADSCNVNLFI